MPPPPPKLEENKIRKKKHFITSPIYCEVNLHGQDKAGLIARIEDNRSKMVERNHRMVSSTRDKRNATQK